MTMLRAFVQVVSVALVLCKEHTILNRMMKAAQLTLGGLFMYFVQIVMYSRIIIYVIIVDEKMMKLLYFLYKRKYMSS